MDDDNVIVIYRKETGKSPYVFECNTGRLTQEFLDWVHTNPKFKKDNVLCDK